MQCRPHIGLFAVLVLALGSVSLSAQDKAGDAAEDQTLYQIELVIFRHLDQSRTTGEIPRVTTPEASAQLEQDLARLSGQDDGLPFEVIAPAQDDLTVAPDTDPETVQAKKASIIPANPRKLLLKESARRIDEIAAYELVAYLNWAQPAPEVSIAVPFDLAEVGADPLLLSGQVELHERRYLHLVLDVTLNRADGQGPRLADTGVAFVPGRETNPALQDSRRVRLNRAQYFDQPQFGVIAMVSRYEPQVATTP